MTDIVEWARKAATCIYIAVEASVADDISGGLLKLAAEVERLRVNRVELLKELSDVNIRLGTVYAENERLRAVNSELKKAIMDNVPARLELMKEIERLRARYDGAMVEQQRQDEEIERLRAERNARAAELELLRANPSEDVAVLQRLLTEALLQRKAAKAEVERLRTALQPFAAMGAAFDAKAIPYCPDYIVARAPDVPGEIVGEWELSSTVIRVSDLSKARAALEQKP